MEKIHIDVLLSKEGEWWLAQCLQYDLVAQTRSFADISYALQHTIIGHIVVSLENHLKPFETLPPAPDRYWRAFRQAAHVDLHPEPVFQLSQSALPIFANTERDFRVGDLVPA